MIRYSPTAGAPAGSDGVGRRYGGVTLQCLRIGSSFFCLSGSYFFWVASVVRNSPSLQALFKAVKDEERGDSIRRIVCPPACRSFPLSRRSAVQRLSFGVASRPRQLPLAGAAVGISRGHVSGREPCGSAGAVVRAPNCRRLVLSRVLPRFFLGERGCCPLSPVEGRAAETAA